MKVIISHKEDMRFEAKTAKDSFIIDCPVISPVEYFLSGMIACSASDMIAIPQSQSKTVTNLSIEGNVVRNDEHPRKFNTLDLIYSFDSDVDDTTAIRWVLSSLETYCSTINTVRDSVKISYSIIHNGNKVRENETMISGGGSGIDFGEIESCPS